MTVPGALDIIHDAVGHLKDTDLFIGAGTVLDAETARAAILAGAHFVVGPVFDRELSGSARHMISRSCRAPHTHRNLAAWKGGADVVKIFPGTSAARSTSRPSRSPAPGGAPATKGVDFETAAAFIKAGRSPSGPAAPSSARRPWRHGTTRASRRTPPDSPHHPRGQESEMT